MSQEMFDYVYGLNIDADYPGVKLSIEIITPETAALMLKANVNNRDKKREPIAKAIKNGEWILNGATIVFSDEGELLDGQNRLYACIEANRPIVTVIARGIKKSAQISMDTGVKRQVVDFLKMKGVKDCNTIASIGTALMNADTYGLQSAFYKRANRSTLKSIVDYIMDNLDNVKFLKSDINQMRKVFKGFSAGSMGVLFDRFYKASYEDAEYFISQLNEPCPSVQPIGMLRDLLLKNASKKERKLSQRYLGAVTIKAWNAYMLGNEISQLKFTQGGKNPESFPSIYGLEESDE